MQKIINYLKKKELQKVNQNWFNIDYILNSNDFTTDYKNKYANVVEVEHQIGRFMNMQKIADEIKNNNYLGDIVEFGTWQGLGILLLNRLLRGNERKFIGIDSFEGLPETSTVWRKGMFNNTSIDFVKSNIQKYSAETAKQFQLIQGWFNNPKVAEQLYSITKDVILVHFDSDLGSSTTDALAVVEPYLLNRTKPIYFLFDDWGIHPDEVPDAFNHWVNQKQNIYKFSAIKLSSTRCTRYYRLDFNLQ